MDLNRSALLNRILKLNAKKYVWNNTENICYVVSIIITVEYSTMSYWYFCTLSCTPRLYQKDREAPSPSTIYKELGSDSTQAIKDDVLFTLDFLHSNQRAVHRTRNNLTAQKSCTALIYGLPKIYTPYLPAPFKPSHTTHASLLYSSLKIYIPYLCLPIRPILSIPDSSTKQFPNNVTPFMQPFVETFPSYICYSNYFVQLL